MTKTDWMDPECRALLLEKLGSKKVAELDVFNQRVGRSSEVFHEVVAILIEGLRCGHMMSPEECLEWSRQRSIKKTNEMSVKAYGDACESGLMGGGSVLLKDEDEDG